MRTVIILAELIIIIFVAVFASWNKLHSRVLLKKGVDLLKQGKYLEAEPICQHVIELDTNNASALRGIGIIRAVAGKLEEAEYFFLRSKKIDDNYKSIRLLAGVYYETEQLEKIEEYIPILIDNKLEHRDVFDIILMYAINQNDKALFEEALKGVPVEYIQAGQHTPDNVALGKELFGLDDNDK
jgi:tetratricopeptide (TPR) repeat protein